MSEEERVSWLEWVEALLRRLREEEEGEDPDQGSSARSVPDWCWEAFAAGWLEGWAWPEAVAAVLVPAVAVVAASVCLRSLLERLWWLMVWLWEKRKLL